MSVWERKGRKKRLQDLTSVHAMPVRVCWVLLRHAEDQIALLASTSASECQHCKKIVIMALSIASSKYAFFRGAAVTRSQPRAQAKRANSRHVDGDLLVKLRV